MAVAAATPVRRWLAAWAIQYKQRVSGVFTIIVFDAILLWAGIKKIRRLCVTARILLASRRW
jgi:hypothetical protein